MKFSMKRALAIFSLAAMCLPSGALLRAQDKDAAAASKDAPEPMFKAEKYKEAFEKGKKEFAAGEYKDAGKSFKKALSGGKAKADKALVNKWVLACKGSTTVKRIELMRERNLWNEAYDQLLGALQRYGETPLRDPMLKLYAELEGALFLNLENFDYANTRLYSQLYGKSFVKDPRYLANGTQCLRWQNTKDGKVGQLKLKNIPRDWSQFQSVEFWIALQVPAGCRGDVRRREKESRGRLGGGATRAGGSNSPQEQGRRQEHEGLAVCEASPGFFQVPGRGDLRGGDGFHDPGSGRKGLQLPDR